MFIKFSKEIFSLLVGLLMISGCASIGNNFRETELYKLTPGSTTFNETVAILQGNPFNTNYSPDGSFIATWQYTEAAPNHVTENKALSILYWKDGKLARVVNSINIKLPDNLLETNTLGTRKLGVLFAGPYLQIASVQAGSVADKAGWKIGDIILSVDATNIMSVKELIQQNLLGSPEKTYLLRRGSTEITSKINFN